MSLKTRRGVCTSPLIANSPWPSRRKPGGRRPRKRALATSDIEDPFREFNVGVNELRARSPKLGYAEVEARLRDLTRTHGVPFGDAEIELCARCLQDQRWPLKHPVKALSWARRHRHTRSLRQRLEQLLTRSVRFVG